jgi:hypothetical protein
LIDVRLKNLQSYNDRVALCLPQNGFEREF